MLALFSSILISPFISYLKNENIKIKYGSQGIKWFFILFGLTFLFFIGMHLILDINISKLTYSVIFLYICITGLVNVLLDNLLTTGLLDVHSNVTIVRSLSALALFSLLIILNLNTIDNDITIWSVYLFSNLVVVILVNKFYFHGQENKNLNFMVNRSDFKKYSMPLMFLGLWAWLSNYFDRFAIEYFLDLKQVGLYSAGYSIGSKVFLSITPIFIILLNPIVYSQETLSAIKSKIDNYTKYFIILAFVILSVLFCCYSQLGEVLLSNKYTEGFVIIFWTALSYFLLSTIHIYEVLIYARGKTKWILYTNISAAIVNIGLNVSLIPRYGILGAAYATCIGFLLQLLLTVRYFRKV